VAESYALAPAFKAQHRKIVVERMAHVAEAL
jgi:hypothetical protein